MESRSKSWNWLEILARLSPLFVSGPGLIIFVVHFLSPEQNVLPDLGWVLILAGYAFLAITTTQNYLSDRINPQKSKLSTVAELGILGTGLALIAPSDLLTYFFIYGFVISVILYGMDIILNRPKPGANMTNQH